jgi:hypothetical protein
MLRSAWARAAAAASDRRAQSETLAVVILTGLVITGSGVVVVLGATAIRGTTESADIGQAEHAMTQLDSKASLVAHGSSDTQRVSVGRGGQGTTSVDPDAGWMRVVNETAGGETVLMNETMGAVVYERGETTVTYQGGGVWRSRNEGSAMVSPPEFHYRSRTLTLPLVLVRGDGGTSGTSGGSLRVASGGDPVGKFPTDASGRTNPLTGGEITVTVKSDHYRAWERFFEQRTGGDASLDHTNRTASVELVVPEETETVTGAITSTARGDEIDMQGGGAFPAFVDSYNSSVGPYSVSEQDDGTIVTTGSVELGGNTEIEGNIRAGGSVDIGAGSAALNGIAYWTTSFSGHPAATYGGDVQIDGVDAPGSAAATTRAEVDDLSTSNDNGGAPIAGSDPRLQFTAGTVTLTPGDYYLEKVDASGGKIITFDTDGNDITVGIESDVSLKNVDIVVQDGGTVRLYIKDDVDIQSGVTVSVPGDRANQFWMYGTHDTDFDVQANQGNPTTVDGVFYAPGDGDDSGDASIKHAELFGAVVAGEVDVETGGAIHYDEALAREEPFPAGTNAPRVTYLHVSTNRVNVTAA